MSIVRHISKERVMNSLPKEVSASTIKTLEEQGKTVLFMKIVDIMNKTFYKFKQKSLLFFLLWKMLPLEQCFIYSARLHKRECIITSWSWHSFVKFSNSLNSLHNLLRTLNYYICSLHLLKWHNTGAQNFSLVPDCIPKSTLCYQRRQPNKFSPD